MDYLVTEKEQRLSHLRQELLQHLRLHPHVSSGVCLLVCVWGGGGHGPERHRLFCMGDVHKCPTVFQGSESPLIEEPSPPLS